METGGGIVIGIRIGKFRPCGSDNGVEVVVCVVVVVKTMPDIIVGSTSMVSEKGDEDLAGRERVGRGGLEDGRDEIVKEEGREDGGSEEDGT